MSRIALSGLVVAASLAGMPALSWAAAPVGVAGAVNPATDSTPPGQQTRTVMVGAQMLMNEKVVTGPQGSTQLVFVDHSTLTIGPSSEVVIDQFVYNPDDGSGKMAVSLGKGVMRFVGGELSHKGNATVNTPTATVGIRGGIVIIRTAANETSVINVFGNSTITSANCKAGTQCTVTIIRPGYGTTVASGGTPDAPFIVPGEQMMALTTLLQSSPTQNGGSATPPSDSSTQNSGTGKSNSGLVASQTQPQSPQGGAAPLDPGSPILAGGPNTGPNNNALVGDIAGQQQSAIGGGGINLPGNFPDGTTSIGDLRTVTGPNTFTYNQPNVPIYYNMPGGGTTQVGSYNFDMTIHLGPPSSRSLDANARNVNVSGGAWPYATVTNVNLNFSLPAPDFQFGGGPVVGGAFGFGTGFTCATGVDCGFGFSMRNSGGKAAAFADHSVIVYQTPPPCSGSGCPPSPLPGTPGIASGTGTASRVVH